MSQHALAGLLLASSGLVAAAAAPVSAAPARHTCTRNVSYNDNSFATPCGLQSSGANRFRALIQCTDGVKYTGPWRVTGTDIYSAVGCPGDETIVKLGIGFTTV